MLAMVSDNAGNNGTLLQALVASYQGQLLGTFSAATSWTRCFAHVLNLSTQAAIDVLKKDPGYGIDRR